jgi:hypothetical protein
MDKDGSCYTGIVEAELRDLNEKCKFENKIVVVKDLICSSVITKGY